uniref:Uncharacterized protein n=1 Tax=Acrobeloides nanus TaxID=290746 RepID=A0A914CX81_9BILA
MYKGDDALDAMVVGILVEQSADQINPSWFLYDDVERSICFHKFYAIFDLEQLFIRTNGELIEGLYGFQDGYCTIGSIITVILSILLYAIIPRILNESGAS